MLSTQPHLDVNGVVQYVIVEELTNLELFHSLESSKSEHSNAKHKWASKSIIKVGIKQPQFIHPSSYGSKRNNQIEHSHSKKKHLNQIVDLPMGTLRHGIDNPLWLQFAKLKIKAKRNLGPIWCY
jgi:hypothetical protein